MRISCKSANISSYKFIVIVMKIERTICPYCGSVVAKNNYCTQCGEKLNQKDLEYTVECMDVEPVKSNNNNVNVMHLQLKLLLLKCRSY